MFTSYKQNWPLYGFSLFPFGLRPFCWFIDYIYIFLVCVIPCSLRFKFNMTIGKLVTEYRMYK